VAVAVVAVAVNPPATTTRAPGGTTSHPKPAWRSPVSPRWTEAMGPKLRVARTTRTVRLASSGNPRPRGLNMRAVLPGPRGPGRTPPAPFPPVRLAVLAVGHPTRRWLAGCQHPPRPKRPPRLRARGPLAPAGRRPPEPVCRGLHSRSSARLRLRRGASNVPPTGCVPTYPSFNFTRPEPTHLRGLERKSPGALARSATVPVPRPVGATSVRCGLLLADDDPRPCCWLAGRSPALAQR